MNNEKKPRILIVEDSPENIHILVNLLQDYQCHVAKNGKKALVAVESELKFDLILLDVMMPVISGFEVKKYLNHNPKTKDVPVIFITSKTDHKDIKKGFDLGAVDYIRKPFDPVQVLARIKKHLS